MNALLFGATGMVGTQVLHQCLDNEQLQQVLAIGRRPTGVGHPKLQEIEHQDFLDFSLLQPQLSKANICFYCVGVYQSKVPEEQFWQITVNYLAALVKTLERVNRGITFCLFSAQGADPDERSLFLFGNAKGRAEKRLTDSGLETKYIFRPGFINPDQRNTLSGFSYWAFKPLYKLLPFTGIDASDLAKVMVHVGLNGNQKPVLENRDLRRAAQTLSL